VARVYRVTGALYVSIGLWTMVAFLQGVSLKLAQESIHLDSIALVGRKSSWLLSALFFGDASLDIVMASVLIYYLTQQKRTAFKRYVVNRCGEWIFEGQICFPVPLRYSIVWLDIQSVSIA
jgi:hypothetical protein